MKSLRIIFRAVSISVALLATTACLDDLSDEIVPPTDGVTKIIPYSVTAVKTDDTKVTVGDDRLTMLFETGDMLIITGDQISGTLTLTSGSGETSATFTGMLEYTGEGTPDPELSLTATLQSEGQTFPIDYYSAIAPTLADAVHNFSSIKGTGTFAAKSFSLSQESAFISFNILLDPVPAEGSVLYVNLYNNQYNDYLAGGTVTVKEGIVSFAAAFEGETTTIEKASIAINHCIANFGGTSTTLAPNSKYFVSKTAHYVQPLTFDILTDGIIRWVGVMNVYTDIGFSINGGEWGSLSSYQPGGTISVHAGDEVRFRGFNSSYTSPTQIRRGSRFKGEEGCTFNIRGNIMSMIDSTSYECLHSFSSPYVFKSFFQGGAVDASELILPATTLTASCYQEMFANNPSLTAAPELPAMTLAPNCYYSMFSGTAITRAPDLPAKTLVNNCYYGMFENCNSLTYIKCLATDISAADCTKNWVNGVASAGTFVRDGNMNDWEINSINGIPEGWTIVPPIPNPDLNTPLTFQAGENGATVTFTGALDSHIGIFYSLTGSYADRALYTEPIHLEAGETVSFFGIGSVSTYTYSHMVYDESEQEWVTQHDPSNFMCSDDCYIYGNMMSLLYPENFADNKVLESDYTFAGLFAGNGHINIHPLHQLMLPATTLTLFCYSNLFAGCSGLTTPPELPATIMTKGCYMNMFGGCSNLVSAPVLPATTLAYGCYASMFWDCIVLGQAPVLPATMLADACYTSMFSGCKALTTAPDLPASNLMPLCYMAMFYECTNLTSVKCLATTGFDSNECLSAWLGYGEIITDGVLYKAYGVPDELWRSYGVPATWTIEVAP